MSLIKIEFLNKQSLWDTSQHSHNFYELYYLLEGKRDYFITNKAFPIVPGMFVLLKPHTYHSTQGQIFKRAIIYFDDEYIDKYLDRTLVEKIFSKNIIDSLSDPSVLSLIKTIMHDEENPDEYHARYVGLKLNELFIMLLRMQRKEVVVRYNYNNKLITQIINYITENFSEALTLEHLSGKFFVSRYHLSHLFKKHTNFNLSQYIVNVRIGEIVKLLDSDLPITEIAIRSGFNSANYMSGQFKKQLGISPQQYRLNLRKSKRKNI